MIILAADVALAFGVEATAPDGYECVGFTREYQDGSFGFVKPDETVHHRSTPVRMRPLFAGVQK